MRTWRTATTSASHRSWVKATRSTARASTGRSSRTTSSLRPRRGAQSLDMRLVGTGHASIFRDGRRQEATWYRSSWFDPFTFYTDRGEKVLLSPGQTWTHILPVDWAVPSN